MVIRFPFFPQERWSLGLDALAGFGVRRVVVVVFARPDLEATAAPWGIWFCLGPKAANPRWGARERERARGQTRPLKLCS